ncbi:substrate-binding domain-containing protein [Rhodanobacter sp. MP1X3]|uniref:substrate-binding domain-containing protein n=1 Tax=Rhodanobacter sp. MP1X3 TaxID=2723086 RepID=UPI0016088505|nr:substrate-binding domain-containing protein [Rhodanobacter sp. MP1X3]MBB6244397.1 phosphate transport system substrate-binding protein [Rhodanobacter sp. MP1X3]
MTFGLTKFSTRTKLVVGAIALVLAGLSHASGTLVGGGATLPSVGYVGSNAASGNLQLFGTGTGTGIAAGSLFGVYAAQTGNPGVSYCLTGSGAGKDVLAGGTIGANTYGVQTNCAKNANGVVNGFGAPAVSRTDLLQPSFAAADSPLAATDVSNYQTGHGSASDFPTQFPVIAGAVGIGFNLTDSTGAQVTASEVNFTATQVCQIFSGTVTAWNDSHLASAFTLPSGHSIPATAINVQYRSDGSGTSFSLSNYLSNNCSPAGLSSVFETSQTFGSTTAGSGGTPAAGSVISNFFTTLPSNWTGTSGNSGVANAIASATGNGNVGYVETANALALGLTTLQLADVASKSPTANFGTPLVIGSTDVVYNEVINPTNATNGTAQVEALTSPPSTECIALVPPTDYAIPGSRGGIVPSTSYPIVAVSYFLGNAQGNISTDLASTAKLVDAPYNATITGSVTTVGSGTGLAFLNITNAGTNFTATSPGACLH